MTAFNHRNRLRAYRQWISSRLLASSLHLVLMTKPTDIWEENSIGRARNLFFFIFFELIFHGYSHSFSFLFKKEKKEKSDPWKVQRRKEKENNKRKWPCYYLWKKSLNERIWPQFPIDPEIENLPDDSFLKEKKENVDGQWKEKEAINTFSSLSNKGIGKVSGSISSSFPFTFDHDVINCFSN